jgi:hypothetical protein
MTMLEKWSREFIRQCNPNAPDRLQVPSDEWLKLREELEVLLKSRGDLLTCAEEISFVNFMFMGVPVVPV